MFKLTLTIDELGTYVLQQLNNFFPDNRYFHQDPLFKQSLNQALERTEYCFKHVALRAYHQSGTTYFSHLHSDQYTLFLWFLSNSVWKIYQDLDIPAKLFNLNKTLNGVICMYDAEMPDIFLVLHGGGIVLGKATYSDFFVCYQGCTIGAINGVYPKLGKGVVLAPQSSVIGNCNVGNLVTIGNGALLRNRNINSESLYYRHIDTGQHIVEETRTPWAQSFFNIPIMQNGEHT
jgi:serine O-acetyltransferase